MRARWIQALLVVIVVVVILAVDVAFAPQIMRKGIFNIAVAEFGEMDSNGEIHSSKAGQQMSEWTVNYLRDELKKEDANLVIWPNQGNIIHTHEVCHWCKPDTAEKTASDINADLLLYGYIDTALESSAVDFEFLGCPAG